MKVGYVRADGQESALIGVARLEAAGCMRVVVDSSARAGTTSEIFTDLVSRLSTGDTVAILNLRHVSSRPVPLLETLLRLHDRGIWIELLDTPFDTSQPVVPAVLKLLYEHGQAGLSVARAHGSNTHAGRPRLLVAEDLVRARQLLKDGQHTAKEVANILGVSRATLYRSLKPNELS